MEGERGTMARSGRTVFVDVNPLADRYLTGIGRYTARLALALAGQSGCGVRYVSQDQEVVAPRGLDWSQDQDLGRWGRRVCRGRRVPLTEAGVPDDSLAVFGCLREEARRFPFEISVLHDFTTLVVPHTHAEKTRGIFSGFFARTLLSSDAAVAVSHSTKADALWLCDFPPERVVVAPSGPSLCVARHLDPAPAARRPDVGLVVSTIEPRKNAFFLLEWFRQSEALPEGSELWWVGPVGWLTSRRKLRQYQTMKGRRVRFLGVVPDKTLCRLYRMAGWSAYPSLYEGFGFPVLDALRHGTPVLSSYHSALRELDHPGVHFFDPYDPATVDDAWRSLRAAGPSAIAPPDALDALYNWDSVARAVLEMGRQKTADRKQEAVGMTGFDGRFLGAA
jgi:glycosyltransferase involved in cell wall biosynthesis